MEAKPNGGQRRRRLSGTFIALLTVAMTSVLLSQHIAEAQVATNDPAAPPTVAPAGPPAGPPAGAPAGPDPAAPPIPAAPVVAYVGDICLNSTQCSNTVTNSECTYAGDNSGTTRCRCAATYYAYDLTNNGTKQALKCGKTTTATETPACSQCETNDGMCVLPDGGTPPTFCQCPISQTGPNCENIHVNVSCSMLSMSICYLPHPQVNFKDGWLMYASVFSKKPQCVGTNVTQVGGACSVGYEQLSLSLNTTDLDTCGTVSNEDSHNKIYSNQIVIQKFDITGNAMTNVTPIVFNTYCSFTEYADQTFNGIGVGRVNGNDRGTQVNPNVTFQVTDQYNRPIAGGVTLVVGDDVQFAISMTIDVNYESLQVMRCTASTSATMPDSGAETRALMNNGCPVPGEATGASWYWSATTSNQQFVLRSNNVPIFKLSSSNNVFFHCSLKLCMTGDHTCTQYTPDFCATQNTRRKRDESSAMEKIQTLSRKKRATSSYDVQTGLTVQDPNSQGTSSAMSVGSPQFIALLVILAIIAFILIIVTVVVVVRTNRRKSVSDSGQPRPQLFALPRISRTHERF